MTASVDSLVRIIQTQIGLLDWQLRVLHLSPSRARAAGDGRCGIIGESAKSSYTPRLPCVEILYRWTHSLDLVVLLLVDSVLAEYSNLPATIVCLRFNSSSMKHKSALLPVSMVPTLFSPTILWCMDKVSKYIWEHTSLAKTLLAPFQEEGALFNAIDKNLLKPAYST